jgi:aspartate aminotransferase
MTTPTIVARRIREVRESDTKAVAARAAQLRATGRSIISLSLGEPDFPTPIAVRAAAHAAIEDGHTRYTPVAGILPLREAICRKLWRDNGIRVQPDDVTVGCGAKQVIFNAFLASLDPGDEVIMAAPCWVSYPEMVRLAGGVPRIVHTCETDGFRLTPALLRDAISPRTKWVLLNSPANPTGVTYSEEELRALAAVIEHKPAIWVLSDEIYEKLVYDQADFASMASAVPAMATRTLTVNGVSKSHAMTGWRVGYGAGPSELITAMNVVQSQSSSHTCSISQHAALQALDGDENFLLGHRAEYSRRRELVVRMLRECAGLDARLPDGAFYVFTSCAGVIGARTTAGDVIDSDTTFASYLLDAGVAVVPGSAFHCSPYIRVSFATDESSLTEGLRRIHHACSSLTLAPRLSSLHVRMPA